MKRRLLMLPQLCLFFSLTSCVYWQSTCKKLLHKAEKEEPYDAIIIPGVPFDSVEGSWSSIMKIRVYWSFFLYKKGIAKNIIYSGSAVYTPYVESKIMGLYAQKLGIPIDHIFTETKAEHSTENIYYSYYLGKRVGFQRMAIASDPFQSRLLKSFARKIKLDVGILPMVFDSVETFNLNQQILIDPKSAYQPQFVSIEKRESFWKRLNGTLGKNYKPDSLDNKNRKGK
ncbi:MAG: YdcF family protein [Opitutaceae bacterium]|nr:YdcF family protein [Cytophagales bacterium]